MQARRERGTLAPPRPSASAPPPTARAEAILAQATPEGQGPRRCSGRRDARRPSAAAPPQSPRLHRSCRCTARQLRHKNDVMVVVLRSPLLQVGKSDEQARRHDARVGWVLVIPGPRRRARASGRSIARTEPRALRITAFCSSHSDWRSSGSSDPLIQDRVLGSQNRSSRVELGHCDAFEVSAPSSCARRRRLSGFSTRIPGAARAFRVTIRVRDSRPRRRVPSRSVFRRARTICGRLQRACVAALNPFQARSCFPASAAANGRLGSAVNLFIKGNLMAKNVVAGRRCGGDEGKARSLTG